MAMRTVSGSNPDIYTRIWLGAAALAMVIACSPDPEADNNPAPSPGAVPGPAAPPMVAGAAALETAYMYVDQPVHLTLIAQAPAMATPDATPSDFRATTWMSDTGTLIGSAIGAPEGCTQAPTVAATGRRLIVGEDYPSIQAAIDAADPGDVVSVPPGTYREHLRLRSNVSLVGAGAWQTTLDGGGEAISLIDYTDARNALVQGFTLTGVGLATGCARPEDPFLCSGNWYAAAIYGDGHGEGPAGENPCADTSILVTQNIVRDNFIGMMSYFHARAVVRNNVFLRNEYGFVANHMQDHALLLQNAFVDNRSLAIGSQAAYLDVVGNLITGSAVAVKHEFIQMGRISCNGFARVGTVGDRIPVGQQGNLTVDQAFTDPANGDFTPTPALIAALFDCLGESSRLAPWSASEPGAYGGVLGAW